MRSVFSLVLLVLVAGAGCHTGEDIPTGPETCGELAEAISAECSPVNGYNWLDQHGRLDRTCNTAVDFDREALDGCLAELAAPACTTGDLPPLFEALMAQHYDPLYARSQGRQLQRLGQAQCVVSEDLSDDGIRALAGRIASLS